MRAFLARADDEKRSGRAASDAAADTNARPLLLLGEPDGIAKLMMAASATINTAVQSLRLLSPLRSEEAAAVPGTQTIYPPGEGPHTSMPQANGLYRPEDDPLRSALAAYREVSKRFREEKTSTARSQPSVCADGEGPTARTHSPIRSALLAECPLRSECD